MTATLIDGRAVAERLRERVAARTAELARHGVIPGLAVVLVGDDPASQVYVGSKTKQAAAAGLNAFRSSPAGNHRHLGVDCAGRTIECARRRARHPRAAAAAGRRG